MRALERRPTTLERWPKGVYPGIVLSTRERRRRRCLLPEADPEGAPDYVQTARIAFPSGRRADEVCPTEIAVVGWAAQMGTITFHPWPVRRDDVDHPDELRIDLDPQPGTDFADAVARRRRGARAARRARLRRLPEDIRRPGHPHLRPDRAALDVHRRPPRRDRVRARARAAPARPGDDQAGGRRSAASGSSSTSTRTRATARSPRPTACGRSRAHRCRRRSPGTSCPRSRPRTSRSRRCRRGSPRWATSTRRSTTSRHSLEPLLELYERDEPRGGRHAVPAGLPEDAGRAQARAALARPRPPEAVTSASRRRLRELLRAALASRERTAAARPARCRRRAPRRGRRSPARDRSARCPCAPAGRPTPP